MALASDERARQPIGAHFSARVFCELNQLARASGSVSRKEFQQLQALPDKISIALVGLDVSIRCEFAEEIAYGDRKAWHCVKEVASPQKSDWNSCNLEL